MNQLANESSLYLRQHANNPVNWYPWGPEALKLARELDRPIFLSIGYSACHWCHVMEHESFENPAIAKILNDHFICIKVDREERPDLDTIYMTSLQLMSREGGGWPLSVWLTPNLHPFYAGTYFPPDNRYGAQRPSFPQLLMGIVDAWNNRRAEIDERSSAIAEYLNEMDRTESSEPGSTLTPSLLESAANALGKIFDSTNGGFGHAPKFPHALEIRLLLRAWKRFQRPEILQMVRTTLDKMAMGGIYDQIGGGFHRYSVDARWLVPHFEKMLYDNALLVPAYLDAWQITGEPIYREVAVQTLDYVLREMTCEAGAFYSTQDADSEGEEGKFYVWSKAEIQQLLRDDNAEVFFQVYDVTDAGNFEGHNILNRPKSWEQLSRQLGLSVEELQGRMKESARKLYEVRGKRVWPGRDEKILAAWNGLMIAAFAQAGAALDEPRYTQAAQRAARFILEQMRSADGRLYRTCGVGTPAKLNGYLEDYAFMVNALVHLYEADFDSHWIESALQLATVMIEQFADVKGGFFFTGKDHEQLIARTKDTYDGSTPSGNSMAVAALAKLATLTDRRDLADTAARVLQSFEGMLRESPGAVGQMLCALDFHLGPRREIVVIGSCADPETKRVLEFIRKGYSPNQTVVFHDPTTGPAPEKLIPLLQGRSAQGAVTTYICENYSCQAPVVGAEGVIKALA
jgi:uncharacterized protein YyaL (SSP411 family)